ncbi:putative hemagglutinin-like secreted protein [Yersinia pseudotuberculosis]|nr:putative hemagglutinin-like secreted protein [Yersinia pseudotuberculosis]
MGRDLLLQSQQDSDNYDAKQQNSSVGGSFSPGSMTGSISINGSQDKLNSNFDSVQEQTGIFAGSGGFDITVGGHTQLDGAVIGSTATADKNTLDTGTLGFSDIDNQADFKVEHQSVGISTGGNIGSQFVGNMANGLLVGANNEGHADSTTHAAVSEGMRAALLDIRVFMMSIYGVFYQSVEDIDFLSERQKNFLSLKTIKFLNIITIVENNALGLALKGCGIAAPCRSLIAKQVLEFGVKAGITGIVAKEIADKISEDDLDHFVMLTMMAGKISLNRFFSLRHFVAS